ncbi:lysine--tRNA ligase [Candidatus Undinarchaeota archaeon]
MEEQRKKKLDVLRENNIEPYPYIFERTHMSKEVLDDFKKLENKKTKVAGRIMSLRQHGAISFMHLNDDAGKIQVALFKDDMKDNYKMLDHLDIGDFVGVEGKVFKTKRGETSVKAKKVEILCKALRSLPEKWHGLKDVEIRYRQRYLDLIVNPEVKETFVVRSKTVKAIRDFMDGEGFLEVETPMLQTLAGGALAKPFITYHNVLDRDLYLRIAPELYLKRLIVGGFEKIYEINRNFRNEGISTKHNPEFTMMEFYWAYADYYKLMDFTEEFFEKIAKQVIGGTKVKYGESEISFKRPFKKYTIFEGLKEIGGIDAEGKGKAELLDLAEANGIKVESNFTKSQIIDELFSELVEPKLVQPTFIYDYPLEMSPLAKKKRDNPELVERFELYLGGMEIVNAYSELNDPIDQYERFRDQVKDRAEGDEEAHLMDSDYVRALEYGMPPTAGWGLGIERFVMILTNSPSIRDVILFPHMKSVEGEQETEKIKDKIEKGIKSRDKK